MSEHPDAKQAILQAAIDEFAEKGIGNARTGSIAKRAGVATGLLHYHFGTKDNLYRSVINAFFDLTILDELTIVPSFQQVNPIEKMQAILYAVSTWMILHKSPNITRFFNRLLAEGKTHIRQFITEYRFSVEKYLISIIEDGNSRGYFTVKYPSYYVLDFIHMISNLVSYHFMLEGDKNQALFFPEPYPETLQEYYMAANIKKIVAPKYLNEINPLPEDLKNVLDTYLKKCNTKIAFGSWTIMVHIIAKLFNDNIEINGE